MPQASMRRGVTVTPNNTIQIAFTWRGRHYRERIPLAPTAKNLDYATRKRAAMLYDIETGAFDFGRHFPDSPRARTTATSRAPTMGRALRAYLLDVERHCAYSTARDYASVVHTHLLPTFGSSRLDEVTVAALRHYIRTWNHSVKRLRTTLTPLRHVFADAHADGLIERNPFERVRLPSVQGRPGSRPDPFSPDELRRILASCTHSAFARLVRFAASTGLRISELLALEWYDVVWEQGVVRVQRALVRGQLKATTKTPTGHRSVKLLGTARSALAEEYQTQAWTTGRIWRYPGSSEPYTGDAQLRGVWRDTLNRAGVRYRPPKQLRHTYASWLLTAGENPSWIAAQMGHTDWAMIRRVYARWVTEARPEAGQRATHLFEATL